MKPLRVVLLGLGLGLMLAPVAFQMFSRAPKGATMLDEFKPFMTDRRLDGFEGYMRQIDGAVRETETELRPFLAEQAGIDTAQFDARFPTFVSFESDWPTIDADMSDLLRRVHGSIDNYEAVDALPSFTLFPWFFVIPGVLVMGLALVSLHVPRRSSAALLAIGVLGIGLVVAPFVFQMFDRAPKGAEMLDEFESIMTRNRVQTVQGYFGAMAVGQGAIRLELIPAARATGLTDAQLADRFPKIVALERDWIGIINDMTPMIGAMSDNVDNYQAIKALPKFTLFPWFFVIPGVLLALLALIARRQAPHGASRSAVAATTPSLNTTNATAPPKEGTPVMVHHPLRLPAVLLITALSAVALVAGSASASAPTKAKPKALVGTFELTPGSCDTEAATGSYFKMILPGGTVDAGPFFENPDSTCANKAFTAAGPGADGGLITGAYQPQPEPPFDATGNSLSDLIIEPQSFTQINFGLSSNPTEPQTSEEVPKPTVKVKGSKLSGDLRSLTASWNNQQFNQGSPKADGSSPGLTSPVTGTYDKKTKEFTLKWSSQIVGGPFNDFTGVWHLEGVFTPAKKG